MTDLATLAHDEQIDAGALAGLQIDTVSLVAGLQDDQLPEAARAALAVAAGSSQCADAVPPLLNLIDDDGLLARTATWALGRLASQEQLVEAITAGGIDQREHAYLALAGLAAGGRANADGLLDIMVERLAQEIDRSKQGFTGLGEQVCRVLGVLGDSELDGRIRELIDSDPYTDRFELERIRKQVADNGRDTETIDELTADWDEYFADDVSAGAPEAADTSEPAVDADAAPEAAPEAATEDRPRTAEGINEADFETIDPDAAPADESADAAAEEAAEDDEEEEPPAGIEWDDFLKSPEATALDETSQQLVAQLGPMLEQIVARMTGMALANLKGQELAAVLLQVLPQALPPQVVQAALSPQAITAFQAICTYLVRTEAAEHGDDLLEGIALVREQLQQQVRASGILGGPDYSDPNAAEDSE